MSLEAPPGHDSAGSEGSLSAILIREPEGLDPLMDDWDRLAVEVGAPFGAPVWARAWWRHLAPANARLAVVAVHSGDDLVGLAPFYSSKRFGVTELRLLSGGFASRLGVLAKSGFEEGVAQTIARTLDGADLSVDILHWEGVDAASPWSEWISSGWPGSHAHRIQEESRRSAPVVRLSQSSYGEWMADKSRNFRSQMRRKRRSIEEKGASVRSADRAGLADDMEGFFALHAARWEDRGGSAAIAPGARPMLLEVGEALIDSGRFRLWMIDGPEGAPVSAQMFLEAGGVLAYWNGGFDEQWGEYSPGVLAILAAIEEGFERGDRLLDLGGGEAAYKERLADEDRAIVWVSSYPRSRRYPLARLRRLPGQAARRASNALRPRLGADRLNRVRGLLKKR